MSFVKVQEHYIEYEKICFLECPTQISLWIHSMGSILKLHYTTKEERDEIINGILTIGNQTLESYRRNTSVMRSIKTGADND